DKPKDIWQPDSGGFLLIADNDTAAQMHAALPTAVDFDPQKHHFNPLHEMDYKRARDFAALVYGISPQGDNTLTVRNGKRALLHLLLAKPERLANLSVPLPDMEAGTIEAMGMISDLMASPVLKRT